MHLNKVEQQLQKGRDKYGEVSSPESSLDCVSWMSGQSKGWYCEVWLLGTKTKDNSSGRYFLGIVGGMIKDAKSTALEAWPNHKGCMVLLQCFNPRI